MSNKIKRGQVIYVRNKLDYDTNYNRWQIRYFSHWTTPHGKVACFKNQLKEGETDIWNEYSIENPLKDDAQYQKPIPAICPKPGEEP